MRNIRTSRYCFVLIYSVFPLLLGVTIYYLFRNSVWINAGMPVLQVVHVDLNTSPLMSGIFYFIIYTLPDAIWSYSLVVWVSALWVTKNSNALGWVVLSVLLGTSFEIGQFFGLFKGYFCLNDLMASAIASLVGIKFTLRHFKFLESE